MGSFVPVTKQEREEMLSVIGCTDQEELFSNLPARIIADLALPKGKSELEAKREMEQLAKENQVYQSFFRGAGAYYHYIPSIVDAVSSKEAFYTAYTPYQAEISQGILQSIFEYQTMIAELTGMEVSNASVYDGATAGAEAVAMCRERKRQKALVSAAIHPQVLKTIQTYCYGNGMELAIIPEEEGVTSLASLSKMLDETVACVYIQHPNFYGCLEPAKEIGTLAKEAKARFIMGVNPISLGILKTPFEYGADIAVGEGQPLGLPLSFGGPYLGFMACTKELMRKLPGRIVGQTEDNRGTIGYVLTLQAREQHIRREKASSNICSNQALCALRASVYMATLGAEGLKEIATQCMSKAHYLADQLEEIGFKRVHTGAFFHEFVTTSRGMVKDIERALDKKGILMGYPLSLGKEGQILWCCTEMNRKEDIDTMVSIVKEVSQC